MGEQEQHGRSLGGWSAVFIRPRHYVILQSRRSRSKLECKEAARLLALCTQQPHNSLLSPSHPVIFSVSIAFLLLAFLHCSALPKRVPVASVRFIYNREIK